MFKNSKTDYSYAQKALREYIENAKKIMSCSYENSQYDILQKMLSNQQECCKQLFPSMFKEEKIISVESAFIALAAPSFEGKTQSAFITDKVKPLYFSFVGCERSQSALPQPIYRNYLNLSTTLRQLADGHDLKDLVKSVNYKFESGLLSRPSPLIVDEIISTTFLLSRCRTFPFWSLGFLKALAEFMKKKSSEHPETHWMELLAGDIEFQYSPMSIHDLESSECFKGLYIFLDEFKSESWSVLLRNLAQAIGLKCVVANTSIKIIDFFGTNTSSSRRENGDDGWSIVFTKLNDANEEILNSEELRLDKSIKAIYEKIRGVRSLQNIDDFENDTIGKFLIALRVNMIRPGVCILFAEALSKFVEKKMPLLPPNFSLGILADFIAKSIADVLGGCKAGMVYKEDGKLAKMALSLTRSFENVSADIGLSQKRPDDFERDIQKLCNKVTYLTDHLFYLDNPQYENSDIFIAFRPSFILRENKLIVKCKNNEGSWTNARWELELSHFNQNDFCTLIGCLFVPIVDSVAYVLKKANLFNKSRPQGYGESKNENCASSDSGNELEVTVASILTESSRHPHDNRVEFTFKGQRGIDFVCNIIRNSLLRIADSNDPEKNMNQFFKIKILQYSDKGGFDLKSFLQSCHFPFIYGWQKDGIQFFDQISDFAQDFYVQKLTRLANQ
ncbi:MAG: hypothetical protein EBU93_04745, partial [Chlamydiae bacterium]|nr:hypothetical protein [Chlamydiota bacterium]